MQCSGREAFAGRDGLAVRRRSADKVFRSGWMYKEGSLVRNWKRRLFILYGSSIEYYEKVRARALSSRKLSSSTRAPRQGTDDKPKGTIKLDTCTISPVQNRASQSPPTPRAPVV